MCHLKEILGRTAAPDCGRRAPSRSVVAGILVLAALGAGRPALAVAPKLINFQALVTWDHDADPATPEVPLTGTPTIRFSVWQHPTSTLPIDRMWWEEQTVPVSNGQLDVALGMAALTGGPTSGNLDGSVFTAHNRWLEYWITTEPAPATPRLQLMAVPYALRVHTVDGANGGVITGDVSVTGQVSVTGHMDLSGNLDVGGLATASRLQLPSGAEGYVLTSDASGYGTWQPPSGSLLDMTEIRLKDSSNNDSIVLDGERADDEFDAEILLMSQGVNAVRVESENGTGGGAVTVFDRSGDQTLILDADEDSNAGNSRIQMRSRKASAYDPPMTTTIELSSHHDGTNGGGYVMVGNHDGQEQIVLEGQRSGSMNNSSLRLKSDGTTTIDLQSRNGDGGGIVKVHDRNGNLTVQLDGDQDSDPGNGRIILNNGADETIVLESKEGRITAQILEITDGADLSESFDVSGQGGLPGPGEVVCIDPADPGKLIVSHGEYDRTVAGVISGAGGVRTGMVMGQEGSIADGSCPVALTGRVYVKADCSGGPIQAGDLLTTSVNRGRAMRAGDRDRAQGAVLGKAMTSLESGEGLVLVLVGLQ